MLMFANNLCAVSPACVRPNLTNHPLPACRLSKHRSSLTISQRQPCTGRKGVLKRYTCKASKDSKEPPWQRQEGASEGSPTEVDNKRKEPELSPQDKKGQRTAIITGFISVAFGVAYLLLVSLLDSRGNVLHPPPPEAFGL